MSRVFTLRRLLAMLLLIGMLVFSISVLGYVVFFRTVLAREIVVPEKSSIVFEEPDPPAPVSRQKQQVEDPALLPMVAIIIDDMGYHRQVGELLLHLDLPLSFSFLPHAPFTLEQEETAYMLGRDVLLHLPLEPKDRQWDPGPGAIWVSDPPEKISDMFSANLNAVPHAIGVNNHMGSLFTEERGVMQVLLDQMKRADVFFVDSCTSPASVGFQLAQQTRIPVARRDVFLDNVHSVDRICAQFEQLVAVAEAHHRAVGIGHPFMATYQALKQCGPLYRGRVHFVGMSEFVGHEGERN